MKTKILQQLKTKYKHFGFSDEVMEGVATQLSAFVNEESGIEPAVSGAEQMLRSFQRYADSRVTSFKSESDKSKAEIEQLRAKLAELEGRSEEPSNPMEGMMKAFNEQMKTLSDSIAKLSNERTHDTLSQKLETLIGADIPKSFYASSMVGRQFKDEDEIASLASTIKESYAEFEQELANKGFVQTKQPEKGNPRSDGDEIAELVNDLNKDIVESKK